VLPAEHFIGIIVPSRVDESVEYAEKIGSKDEFDKLI
jgi:hypothetical protein